MIKISTVFKAFRKINEKIFSVFYTPIAKIALFLNGAKIGNNLYVKGLIKVYITRRGNLIIGKNLRINSGSKHNIIGRQQKNIFWVEGKLSIGDNVGMSCSAIICNQSITIGNNVTIGGNTVIYDTNFHSLDPIFRLDRSLDNLNVHKAPVVICDNVFIGAHSTVLKGVTIGTNSIVGACSLVSKDIPENEIWGGNPARFIRKIPVNNK